MLDGLGEHAELERIERRVRSAIPTHGGCLCGGGHRLGCPGIIADRYELALRRVLRDRREPDKVLAEITSALADPRVHRPEDEEERVPGERYGFGVCLSGRCVEPCGPNGGCVR